MDHVVRRNGRTLTTPIALADLSRSEKIALFDKRQVARGGKERGCTMTLMFKDD